jgi:molybdopterin-binding protein
MRRRIAVNIWRTTVTGIIAAAAALSLIGCGSDRAGSVTAPTTITAPAVSTASTHGVVAFDHGNDGEAVDGEAPVTSLVAGTSCPALSFMVGDFTVSVTSTTTYAGGGCSDIKPGVRLEVKGMKSGTTVAANAIEFKGSNSGPGGPHTEPVEGEGVVTSLVTGTSCPTLQFMIGTFSVTLDATTTFDRGTCADVKVGSKLEVTGTMDSTTHSVVAARVEFRNNNNPHIEPVEGEGVVTSLVTGTSCPALQFMIGTFSVTLGATTTFERGTCADVKVGSKLDVTGSMDSTTHSVVATRVEFRGNNNDNENEPAEGEGIVISLVTGTSCPTLQFMIGSFLVKLDATTVFDKGACADIQVGSRVHVKGGLNRTSSSVAASRISVQSDSPGHPEVEGESRVTSLVSGTSCPALQFMVDEWTVTTQAATVFVGGTCADVAAGKKVGVKGTVTGEHKVLATQVVFKTEG